MKLTVKKCLLYIWNNSIDIFLYLKDCLYIFCDRIYSACTPAPKVLSIAETIAFIIEKRVSVSRFGDGEIKIAAGKNLAFQKCTADIQKRMQEVLSKPIDGHIVCLPDIFRNLSIYKDDAQKHWKHHLSYYRKHWYKHTCKERIYYNAFISRCYLMFCNKDAAGEYFSNIKKIWNNKDILLIEGEKSRLGVGNNLFDNVNSIKRILAPNTEAWDYYSDIIKEVEKYSKEYLILLALGPTATVLAYDLSLKGYQAIDIGHVDIEYEWFRMGATEKVPIPNKFVNEAGAGVGVGDIDNEKYKSEIVCRF